jgi:hypothetical protein
MKKYIKLFEDFADDYPKRKFVELSHPDAMEYAKDILDLIQNAYSAKGGNIEIKTINDLKNGDITYWILNDVDSDPDADIVVGGKFTKNGVKITVMGQDGSSQAKREAIGKISELMKKGGFYAEMDKDLAQKIGLKHIQDEKLIRRIIDKELKYNNDGSYDRKIGGHTHTKVLVGNPE